MRADAGVCGGRVGRAVAGVKILPAKNVCRGVLTRLPAHSRVKARGGRCRSIHAVRTVRATRDMLRDILVDSSCVCVRRGSAVAAVPSLCGLDHVLDHRLPAVEKSLHLDDLLHLQQVQFRLGLCLAHVVVDVCLQAVEPVGS